MAQAAPPRPSRWPRVALLFAICAALSAWNPLAAPAGLIVGIGAVLIAWRAAVREEGRTRRIAICAVALGGGAVVASAVVLLLSSGMLSRNLPEQAVVPGRAPNEVKRLLEEAERRTEAARGRAADELRRLPPARSVDGGPSGSAKGVRTDGPAGEKKHEPWRSFDSR